MVVFFIAIISCDHEPNILDAEVNIIRTYKIGETAFVKYTVENTGDKIIRGWNVYFRISMESSKQIKAHDGLTYDLEVEETSEILIASGEIPDHFNDLDKPSLATLQLIEAY